MKNFDTIEDKVKRNVPPGISNELVQFVDSTNLIKNSPSNMYNGLSRKQCLYFICLINLVVATQQTSDPHLILTRMQ